MKIWLDPSAPEEARKELSESGLSPMETGPGFVVLPDGPDTEEIVDDATFLAYAPFAPDDEALEVLTE